MNNKETISRVYDEIHAPDALFGKVMEMNKKDLKKRNIVKYAVGTAAALVIAMVTSNGVCYAATGETWIGKAIAYVNGEKSEQEITWHQNGDTVYGELEVSDEDGEVTQVEVFDFASEDEIPEQVFIMTEDGTGSEDLTLEDMEDSVRTEYALTTEVVQENDRIFFVMEDQKIDITEDFSDGEATGTIEFSGLTFTYTITGSVEESEISLICE